MITFFSLSKNSRDTNNSLRFESSGSKIFVVCLFAVKVLYFAGTTSPGASYGFPCISTLT